MRINQYSIIIVNLDPTLGSEIKKTRPCLVISPNEMNFNLRTIVIAPLPTTLKEYPTRVNVKYNRKIGRIALDQIRTIDKERIVKIAGNISSDEIINVKNVIEETYVK
jgi:mRNA interferase MazF